MTMKLNYPRCKGWGAVALLFALGLFAAGCSGGGGDSEKASAATLRLGYFPNVTHAPAIVGVAA